MLPYISANPEAWERTAGLHQMKFVHYASAVPKL